MSSAQLRGKGILVTGAASGLGEATARHLASFGVKVGVLDLNQERGEKVAAEIGGTYARCDVTDDASVAEALAAVRAKHGVERILVNCAGIIQRAGREFTMEGFQKTMDVNLSGAMRMCLAAKEKLAASGGSIVNTASMLTFQGSPFTPGYAASKGAVGQLTKSLAAAWAPEGIRVNAIAPGYIETDLTRPLVEDAARSAGILARTPMGRWGTPADLGGVVVFLASDAARFVTGAILPVDGGYQAI